MCHQPWPWPHSHSPLADERRAARIAVLVGCGRVEVDGWSPEVRQWAVEGRVTGRAGAGAGAAVQRTRKDRVAQLDLLDDDRAHVVLELHAPGLGVGGAGGFAMQVLELARCAGEPPPGQRTAAGAARAAGPPSAGG